MQARGERMAYEKLLDSIDEILTGSLFEALKAVDCQVPGYGAKAMTPDEARRAKVRVGHVLRSPEARYLVEGLGTELELYVQLNVYRLVVVYRLPGQGTVDREALQPRFARWALGATDAGWTIGWRDALEEDEGRWIEVYCYATLPFDFLADERHQLYWITDIVQMTRSFMIEARRVGVVLTKAKLVERTRDIDR
jgi:hypothetical protein